MVDQFVCVDCGASGEVTPQDAIDNECQLLSEGDDGNLICFKCYMIQASTCHYCNEVTDLMPSTRCNSAPWLCEECLNLPFTVHVWSCYSDGCMTPEEFVDEIQRIEEWEAEEDGYTSFN